MEYATLEWRDGQPYSPDFDDIYFSANDGRSESEYVFLQQNDLAARFAKADRFVIAETGFGSGLNFALTLKLWTETAPPEAQLDYIGIENAPMSPENIARIARLWPELESYFSGWLSGYPLPVAGRHLCLTKNPQVRLHLVFMDVQTALSQENLNVDAWYLDGFAPSKNPQIWNQAVYDLLAQNSAANASLATFTAAGDVRRGLQQAGFDVTKCKGHGNKREMITAHYAKPEHKKFQSPPWFQPSEFSVRTKHVAIIGAGLAGLTVAWALIRRGWQVTLVDKHAQVAAEASGIPAGIVMPRLAVEDTVDAQFYRSAFLFAIAQLKQLQSVYGKAQSGRKLWRGDGVYANINSLRAEKMLRQKQLAEEFVRICADDALPSRQLPADSKLLFIPSAGWASPALICQTLQSLCGDSLRYVQAEVGALHQTGAGWRVESTAGEDIIETELLVLANGIHVADFSQTSFLPVESVRGQLSELSLKSSAQPVEFAYSAEHYIAPALNQSARYYCGASYDLNDPYPNLRALDHEANVSFSLKHFPETFKSPTTVEGYVGFRAVSDDRLPVVGAVPDIAGFNQDYSDLKDGKPESNYPNARYLPGLYVSAAHGSRGITSSFLSAEIIAADVAGGLMPVATEISNRLCPARFIVRRLKRGV